MQVLGLGDCALGYAGKVLHLPTKRVGDFLNPCFLLLGGVGHPREIAAQGVRRFVDYVPSADKGHHQPHEGKRGENAGQHHADFVRQQTEHHRPADRGLDIDHTGNQPGDADKRHRARQHSEPFQRMFLKGHQP